MPSKPRAKDPAISVKLTGAQNPSWSKGLRQKTAFERLIEEANMEVGMATHHALKENDLIESSDIPPRDVHNSATSRRRGSIVSSASLGSLDSELSHPAGARREHKKVFLAGSASGSMSVRITSSSPQEPARSHTWGDCEGSDEDLGVVSSRASVGAGFDKPAMTSDSFHDVSAGEESILYMKSLSRSRKGQQATEDQSGFCAPSSINSRAKEQCTA